MIRPEFFSDSKVGPLPDPIRLFYVGLWTLADDAGYIEWEIPEVGAALYPYKTPGRREKDVREWVEVLEKKGRIQVLSCGNHLRIPTIERHRIQSGRQSYNIREDHRGCRGIPGNSGSRTESLSESLSESLIAPAREEEDRVPEEWKALGERYGSKRGSHA